MKFIEVEPGSGLATTVKHNGSSVSANVGNMHWKTRPLTETGAPPLASAFVDSGKDGDADVDNLVTFCIELNQHVHASWHTYSKAAPNSVMSQARADALDRLADNFWSLATGWVPGNAVPNAVNLVDAVAFQLAVWEIAHESPLLATLPASLNVAFNQGTFFVNKSNPSGNLLSAITLANSWLSQLAAGTLPNVDPFNEYTLVALTHAQKQDQIVQIYTRRPPPPGGEEPVPEPAALAVWSLLAAVGAAVSACRRLA